jgi:hypothetical protein
MCPPTCEFFKNPDLVCEPQFSNFLKKGSKQQHIPKINQLFGYMSVHKKKCLKAKEEELWKLKYFTIAKI